MNAPSITLKKLFEAFDDKGAEVILWKGGDKLKENLAGDGDVDLLVREGGLNAAHSALEKLNFRQIESASWRRQAMVEDWFGVDEDSGRLLHIQLYEKLVLGSAFSKQIEAPGADDLFDAACGTKLKFAAPAAAAVLRVCRAALAQKSLPGRSSSDLRAEARKLTRGVEVGEIKVSAARLFDPETAVAVVTALTDGRLKPLRKRLSAKYRLKRQPGLSRVFLAAMAKWNRRYFKAPMFVRRQVGRPAPIVAVIGSDGSGKSTVSRRLVRELNEKSDTRFIYFGTGDGPGSLIRKPMVWMRKLLRYDSAESKSSRQDSAPTKSKKREIPRFAKALWAITVARERRSKMRQARRAAAAGMIVITDRYPQIEFSGIHDGPRLGEWIESGGWRRSLARWERRKYECFVAQAPDLVLLLDVSPELAAERRPEEPPDELKRRIEVARALNFGTDRRVVVDASEPLGRVVARSLKEVIGTIKL